MPKPEYKNKGLIIVLITKPDSDILLLNAIIIYKYANNLFRKRKSDRFVEQ